MNFLEDGQIVSSTQTRSIKKCRDSLPIPMNLVIEIFLRLPAKSVGKCRCLSKFWANVINSQYFVDLFSAKSSARPQILFASPMEFSFFSADQPFENSSSDNIARTHVTHYPYPKAWNWLSSNCCKIGVPINGLVCLSEYVRYIPVPVIFNPSTGEFLTLPKLKTMWRRQDTYIKNMLGYDPIIKQFKVLSIDTNLQEEHDINNLFVKYQVLTLETQQLSWRTIECFTPQYNISIFNEICINGVLYYIAFDDSREDLIVCFDVISETFRVMKVMERFNKSLPLKTILTNYNGKLGLLIPEESRPTLNGGSRSFELWVLKDAEKQEWSKHVFVLPPVWKNVVTDTDLRFVGMIGTNKIVLSSSYTHESPYFFSYNIGKNTIRRINIEDKKALILKHDIVFLNHVENVMSLSKFLK